MISCKDIREPSSGSQREAGTERTNYEVGSMGVGAGLYMYVDVVKSSRSLSHLLMSSCVCRTGQQIAGCRLLCTSQKDVTRFSKTSKRRGWTPYHDFIKFTAEFQGERILEIDQREATLRAPCWLRLASEPAVSRNPVYYVSLWSYSRIQPA